MEFCDPAADSQSQTSARLAPFLCGHEWREQASGQFRVEATSVVFHLNLPALVNANSPDLDLQLPVLIAVFDRILYQVLQHLNKMNVHAGNDRERLADDHGGTFVNRKS